MKLIAHMLITLLALTAAIPIYAMHSATGEQMDTADDSGESTTIRRSGRKRKQREISLDSESQATVATEKDKNHICTVCGKAFNKQNLLINHTRTHTSEKPFKCEHPRCGRSFSEKSNLTKHMRIHTGEKPYKCTTCDKEFALKGNLKKHMKTHTAKRTKANPVLSGLTTPALAPNSVQAMVNILAHHRALTPSSTDTLAATPSLPSPAPLSASPAPAAESTASSSDQSVIGLLPPLDHSAVLMESSVTMNPERAGLMAGLLDQTNDDDADKDEWWKTSNPFALPMAPDTDDADEENSFNQLPQLPTPDDWQ